MNDLKKYKTLQKMTALVNDLEKALNELIAKSRAYDARKNKAA